tara:strand:+ start:2536 stop:3744 length:1209 start_codon:yes stop_codon:yes gene_type:complete
MKSRKFSDLGLLVALWLMMFAASSQTMIMSSILPNIQANLGIPAEYLGTLIAVYSIMLAIFALITGPISDVIGRRWILFIGTGTMCLILVLHNFVTDYRSLFIVRGFSGIAAGILSGVVPAYIADHFPAAKRGWANSLVMTAIAVGQIMGIPIGTLLAHRYDFAAPFSFFAAPMSFSFILTWILTSRQPLIQLSLPSLKSVTSQYKTFFITPHTSAAIGAYAMMFLGITFYVIYLIVWIKEMFNPTGNALASLFVVSGIASVIVGPWAGRFSDRIGRKGLIIGSCIGLFFLMSLTTTLITEFWIAYLLFFTIMLLVSARMGPFQTLLSEIVPANQRGSMMSLAIAIGQLTMGICSAASGIVYTTMGYFFSSVIGGIGMLVMGYLVWRFIPENKSQVNPDQMT